MPILCCLAAMPVVRDRVRTRDQETEERVTPLELFFDLVFVFAITQVTGFMARDPTWRGLGQGLLVLAALWWAWAAYSWLTNTVDPDEDVARISVFIVMAAMLIVSLAVPGAFGADALLFGCAYFVVRVMHVVLYWVAGQRDEGLHSAVARLAPGAILGPSLLILASAFDGLAQSLVWLAALVIDYGGVLVAGSSGWRLSPGHFAERHGLIVIIALGESIVAIGAGSVSGIKLGVAEVTAAVLAIGITAALWWAYFDVVALVAERKLTEASGAARNALARDSYSYLHLVMIAGIVLLALGIKKTLSDVHEPLATIPAVALCGGVATYLLGHIAFRLRNVGTLNRQRLVAACACAALIPLALNADAIVAICSVSAVCVGLIAYEAIRFGEARARVRAAARP
jgi:low temperature requirement protein LtrA